MRTHTAGEYWVHRGSARVSPSVRTFVGMHAVTKTSVGQVVTLCA